MAWAFLAAVVVAVVVLGNQPRPMSRAEAERRLQRRPLGNVTVLRKSQDDDPLMGCCGRCGRWWSQHPSGYCPDAIDRGGLVPVHGPRFLFADEVEDAG